MTVKVFSDFTLKPGDLDRGRSQQPIPLGNRVTPNSLPDPESSTGIKGDHPTHHRDGEVALIN